jgi:hypothetical protein
MVGIISFPWFFQHNVRMARADMFYYTFIGGNIWKKQGILQQLLRQKSAF